MSTFGVPDWGEGTFADGGTTSGTPAPPPPPPAEPPVIVSFTGSASMASPGDTVTLSFDVSGATSLSISPDIGAGVTSPVSVSPTTTTTYTLTAVGPGGSAAATFTVTVNAPSAENIRYHQIRRNDRQGDGIALQMSGPGNTAIEGYPALYDAGGNVVARQPRGTTTVAQLADQAGGYVLNHLLAFDAGGNAKDSNVLSTDVVTAPGGGTALTTEGFGSWYGQVPRGTQNGTNAVFTLDYRLVNPYTVLHLNGVMQLPSIQGDQATLTGTMAVPGGEYSITDWTLTVDNVPKSGERFYIEYFRADPGPLPAAVASATVSVWTAFTSPDSVAHAFAVADFVSSESGTIHIVRDNILYSRRHDSYALTSFPTTVSGFAGALFAFGLDGTLFANSDNSVLIYDAYIELVLEDASVQTIRPTTWGFYAGSDTPTTSWEPTHGYITTTQVLDRNVNVQTCTVAGTSGATEPVWATSGNTTDGGVTWTFSGSTQASSTGKIANPTAAYDTDISPPTTFATFTRNHYSGLSSGGTFTLIF